MAWKRKLRKLEQENSLKKDVKCEITTKLKNSQRKTQTETQQWRNAHYTENAHIKHNQNIDKTEKSPLDETSKVNQDTQKNDQKTVNKHWEKR